MDGYHPSSQHVAPEFLSLAISEGCRVDCEEDGTEVLNEATVTAEADRLGLTPAQRQAAVDYYRARIVGHWSHGMWLGVLSAVERVAETPWHREVGAEAHFDRLDLAEADDAIAFGDRHVEELENRLPYEPERNREVLAGMRQHLAERRWKLRANLREHAWRDAVAARSATPSPRHRRPHAPCARRRGAGRPKASSSRSSARSGDSPPDASDPAPACRPATRHEAAFR